jgi:hypothetical protein
MRALALIAGGVVLAVTVAGCGGSGSASTSASTPSRVSAALSTPQATMTNLAAAGIATVPTITGFVTGQIPGILQPIVDPILASYIELATEQLDRLVGVDGSVTIVVSHHQKRPPKPTPSAGSSVYRWARHNREDAASSR